MNYKELCKSTEERRYTDIAKIKEENVFVESKPIQKIKDNWVICLAIVALFIGAMLINFELKYFLICIALMVVFVGLFIIGNKYTVTCEKEAINIKQNFQNIHIPYSKVKNVFVAKTVRGIFVKSYVLVVRCEDQLALLREFEFPLLCADIKDVEKFVNNFKLLAGKNIGAIKRDKRRSLKRIVENAFVIVCILLIGWVLISRGIL